MLRWTGGDEVLGDAGKLSGYRDLLRKRGLLPLNPDELTPAAESALVHRLLEDGDNPKEWTVLALWASGRVYAVALEGEGRVRAFTVVPEGEGYAVLEVTQGERG